MVGQHIPSLPTKLAVEKSSLTSYGETSEGLLIAKELLEQNKVENLRRTGNLPISQLVLDMKSERGKYQEMLEADVPHYLEHTHNAISRDAQTKNRYTEILALGKSAKLAKSLQKDKTKTGTSPLRARKKETINIQEKLANEEILKSIRHKLNYLRNPKGNPNGVPRSQGIPKGVRTES